MPHIIVPSVPGEPVAPGALADDLIAFYRFEELEGARSVALDWKHNFHAVVPAERVPGGYVGQGLPAKADRANFRANMLLDELPSSLKISVEFWLRLTQELRRGEHGTYTLFSKQWASGMKLYAFFITRLETLLLGVTFGYLNADPESPSLQVAGATFGSIGANGVFDRLSPIRYRHAVDARWEILWDAEAGRWELTRLALLAEETGEVLEAAAIHFVRADAAPAGAYVALAAGSGEVEALGVVERAETRKITLPARLTTDAWHKATLILDLRPDYLSKFGVFLDEVGAAGDTDFVVDLPVNTRVTPELIGGDLSDVRLATNDPSVPYIMDKHPLPSSHRRGLDAVLDEAKVFRILRKPHGGHERPKLTVVVVGAGSVVVAPVKPDYDHLEEVILTAVPDDPLVADFIGWTGHLSGDDNPETLTMTPGDKYVYANFMIVPLEVETLAAQNVGSTSARLRGELVTLGYYDKREVYFQYKELGAPGWKVTSKQEKFGVGIYHQDVSVSVNSNYLFRAVGVGTRDDGGDPVVDTVYGETLYFTTPHTSPSGLSMYRATFSGAVGQSAAGVIYEEGTILEEVDFQYRVKDQYYEWGEWVSFGWAPWEPKALKADEPPEYAGKWCGYDPQDAGIFLEMEIRMRVKYGGGQYLYSDARQAVQDHDLPPWWPVD